MMVRVLVVILSMSHVMSVRDEHGSINIGTGYEVDDLVKLWPQMSRAQDSLDPENVTDWKVFAEQLPMGRLIEAMEAALPIKNEKAKIGKARCVSNLNVVEHGLKNSSEQVLMVQTALSSLLGSLTHFSGAPPGLDEDDIRSWMKRIEWEINTATIVQQECKGRCGYKGDALGVATDVRRLLQGAVDKCKGEVKDVPHLGHGVLGSFLKDVQAIKTTGTALNQEAASLSDQCLTVKENVLKFSKKKAQQVADVCELPANKLPQTLQEIKTELVKVTQDVDAFTHGFNSLLSLLSTVQEARHRAHQLPPLKKADFTAVCGGYLLLQDHSEVAQEKIILKPGATHMSAEGILSSIRSNGLMSARGLQKLTDGNAKALASADEHPNRLLFLYAIPSGMEDRRVERLAEMAVLTACEREQDRANKPGSQNLTDRAANTALFVMPQASVPEAAGSVGEVAIDLGDRGVQVSRQGSALLCGSQQVYAAAMSAGFHTAAVLVTGEMAMLTPQSRQAQWDPPFGPTPFSAPDYASALKSQLQLLGDNAVIHMVRLPPQ